MNRMISVGSGVGVLLLAGTASAAYQGMSADLHASSAHGDTYRIYVDLDAGDRLDAVYGSSANGLVLGGPGLYQNGFGAKGGGADLPSRTYFSICSQCALKGSQCALNVISK